MAIGLLSILKDINIVLVYLQKYEETEKWMESPTFPGELFAKQRHIHPKQDS